MPSRFRGKRQWMYITNDAGEPIPCDDLEVWGRWFENIDNRRVAQDRDEGEGPDGVFVSTVCLGMDHQYGDGPPILWETLVQGGPLDGEMDRYSSLADALAGHQRMCARVRAAKEEHDD